MLNDCFRNFRQVSSDVSSEPQTPFCQSTVPCLIYESVETVLQRVNYKVTRIKHISWTTCHQYVIQH